MIDYYSGVRLAAEVIHYSIFFFKVQVWFNKITDRENTESKLMYGARWWQILFY
jgi:hypothetical protein